MKLSTSRGLSFFFLMLRFYRRLRNRRLTEKRVFQQRSDAYRREVPRCLLRAMREDYDKMFIRKVAPHVRAHEI